MKVFTIDTDNNITVYGTRKAAREVGGGVFETEEQFAEAVGPDSKRLIEIWNSLPGVTAVKKFTSRNVAAKRIFGQIQNLEVPGHGDVVEAAESEGKTVDDALVAAGEETKAKRKPKAKPAAKAKAGKKSVKPAKPAKTNNGATVSKKDVILALVSRPGGAALEEIMAATGWQKHSVRGFIATLGKKGTKIESFKTEAGARTYQTA